MPDKFLPTRSGFDALSKAEQTSDDPAALPLPESHFRLAEERLKRFREDPSRRRSALAVLDRLADTSNANDEPK